MHCSSTRQNSAFDQTKREAFEKRTPVPNAPSVQRAERTHQIRHAPASRPERPGCSRKRKERVNMDQIVVANVRGEPLPQRPGKCVEADLTGEIPISNTVLHHWLRERNSKLIATIIIRC